MVQKIGLKKTNKNDLNYFKRLIKNETINIDNIKTINSIIINTNHVNVKLLPNLNKIRIQFVIEINIIYSTTVDPSLCAYKDCYVCYETIDVPKIIKGYNILEPNFLNKLQKEINVEEINVCMMDSRVTLSYFLIINLKVAPTHSIGYIIDNGFGSNIFLSHINGDNLTQKTFLQDTNINNISWDMDSSNLWFTCDNFNTSALYYFTNNFKNINICKNVNIKGCIDNFVFKNKNEIIFSTTNKIIYVYNLLSQSTKPLLNLDNRELATSPYYSKSKDMIYFLMSKDSDFHLYSLDRLQNIDIIFNYTNVLDYYVSCCENFLIVKVIRNNKLSLFEIDLSTKLINQIVLDNDNIHNILDIKYITNNDNRKELLILTKNSNDSSTKNSLYTYDFEDYILEKLIDINCTCFDIDQETLDLFMINKQANLNVVNKLSLKEGNRSLNLETILKIPGDIKVLNIKKV